MKEQKKRLFFAVNLPKGLKEEIAEKILPLIPKDKWRKVLPKNLHVTIHFLGYLPMEVVKELGKQASAIEEVESFDANANCVGHFKGNVLWIGFGKGTEEFNLLNRKLQEAIGTRNGRFHAHITLARNKGASKEEVENLVKAIREKFDERAIEVKSLDLMESSLRKAGPEYVKLFFIPLGPKPA